MTMLMDVVNKYANEKTASAANANQDLVKTAKEAGVDDGEKLVKLATHIGELIGTTAGNKAVSMINDALAKIAGDAAVDNHSAVGGLSAGGQGQVAAAQSEDSQNAQIAMHNAEMAMTSAKDAVDALGRGDQLTATQQMSSAASFLANAKALGAKTSDAGAHAKIQEAAAAVAAHANSASAAAGA